MIRELAAQVAMPIGLIVLLISAVEIGYRIGRHRIRASSSKHRFDTGAIQGAMLGILGLLLAFSFGGASGRFLERQDLITREANAIGTAYLRADLLPEAERKELKTSLAAYLGDRVRISRTFRETLSRDDVQHIAEQQNRIWSAATAGVEARPATMNVVISSVNEVLDLHGYRIGAGRKHLPGLVLCLLVASSALTVGVMGYASAFGRHRNPIMTSGIAMLIAAVLWTTIDLDWPRIGVIRLSDQALIDLHESLNTG